MIMIKTVIVQCNSDRDCDDDDTDNTHVRQISAHVSTIVQGINHTIYV